MHWTFNFPNPDRIKTFKIRKIGKIRQIRRDGQDLKSVGQDNSSYYGYNLDYRWWCVQLVPLVDDWEDGCYLQPPEVNLMPNFTCHPRCSGYANP